MPLGSDRDVEDLVAHDGVEGGIEPPRGRVERGQVGPDTAVDAGQVAADEDRPARTGEGQHTIRGHRVPGVERAVGQREGGRVVADGRAGLGEAPADVQHPGGHGQSVHLGVTGRVGVGVVRGVAQVAAVERCIEGRHRAGGIDGSQAGPRCATDRAELPSRVHGSRRRIHGQRANDVVSPGSPCAQRTRGGGEGGQPVPPRTPGLGELPAGVDREAVSRRGEGPDRSVGARGEPCRGHAGRGVQPSHPGVRPAADVAELAPGEQCASGHDQAADPAVGSTLEPRDEVRCPSRGHRGQPSSGKVADRSERPPRNTRVPSKAMASTGMSGLGFHAVTAPAAVTCAA